MEPEFDQYGDSYDDVMKHSIGFMGKKHDFYTEAKVDCLLENLEALYGSGSDLHVLDVGCGTGNTDRLLYPRVGALSGVDVSAASIERAQHDIPQVDYKVYDGFTLPYEDETFNAAILICVMHHVLPEHRSGLLEEVRRVLKPGGSLFIFEHNPYHPLTRLVVARCEFDRDAQLLTRRLSCDLLAAASYEPFDSRYILYLPFKVGSRSRMAGWQRWLPLGAQYFAAGVKN